MKESEIPSIVLQKFLHSFVIFFYLKRALERKDTGNSDISFRILYLHAVTCIKDFVISNLLFIYYDAKIVDTQGVDIYFHSDWLFLV